ncbi:hypothetical protein BDZ89DRAFT_972725 [Hymenopellis radicata]|nr:hypothetical protein BDZ89DRAFT_972725 [Hymenopellis radicata]
MEEGDDVTPANFRCCDNECFALGLVCKECCVEAHSNQPFHFIEEYNGTFYEPRTLRELGLVIQLAHPSGVTCLCPTSTTQEFVILHTNGVHTVNLAFCGCSDNSETYLHRQLLQSSLWPSTPTQPRTAVTFGLLKLTHSLNRTGKLPAWDIWKSLEALTVDRLDITPPDRYKVLLRVLRQWRHLWMCKSAGRGYDPSGIAGTAQGELAVDCPACPHPGRNLPNDWQTLRKSFLYQLFIALDANFRLRNSIVSTHERDPSLGEGMAYFVPRGPYLSHIRSFVNQEEMSSCSGFQAMFLANLKNVKGLRTTGVVGVTCSRHSVWRPNGMGDLQRGERQDCPFCNVDSVVISACGTAAESLELVFSYDIACQWRVNFFERFRQMSTLGGLHFDPDRIRFFVPKFHLWAHQPTCHAPYSLNFGPGVGRTHGETIEENWSQSNRAASQTKPMGPGSRQDTLDDIFGAHNIRTILSFGRVLLIRLADAVKEARVHAAEFTQFDAGMIIFCTMDVVDGWLMEVRAWERDHDQPCPFEPELQNKETMKDVELQLAKEEHALMVKNNTVQETGLSAMIIKARSAGTTYQELNIQKQRTKIRRAIKKFRGKQQLLMPHLREYLTADQVKHLDDGSILAEETKLFFPSDLKNEDRKLSRACSPELVEAEKRVRLAECRDTLEAVRRGLRTRSAGVMFAIQNVTGQNPTTRAQGIHMKVQIAIKLAALQYRWARNALFRLQGHGDWEQELQILKEDDIRVGPPTMEAVVSRGEGRRRPSWIWSSYSDQVDLLESERGPVVFEALKIEWCKARARKLRFEEEVDLLLEEMRRVIAYGHWKAAWWRERADGVPDAAPGIRLGIRAYSESQAVREERHITTLEGKWRDLRGVGEEFLAGLPVSHIVEVEVDAEDEEDEEDLSLE